MFTTSKEALSGLLQKMILQEEHKGRSDQASLALLKEYSGHLSAVSSTMEMSILASSGIRCEGFQDVVIDAKRVLNALKALDAEDVTGSSSSDMLTLNVGTRKITFAGVRLDEGQIERPRGWSHETAVVVDGREFGTALDRALRCAIKKGRPWDVKGVTVQPHELGMAIGGTDGFVVSYTALDTRNRTRLANTYVLSVAACRALSRLCIDSRQAISVCAKDRHLGITDGVFEADVMHLRGAQVPEYSRMLELDLPNELKIKRNALLEAVKLMEVQGDKAGDLRGCVWNIERDKVQVTTASMNRRSTGHLTLDAEYRGDSVLIKLDPTKLRLGLSMVTTEDLVLKLGLSEHPVRMEKGNLVFMVMPMTMTDPAEVS